jgi:peptidoglycan/LPS O-acetylase OafA/YrhL
MKRIPALDGIRALAILMVFLHHALNVVEKLNIHGLWMGVDIFFVLSGFLITGVLLDAKQRTLTGFFAHFYERRVRRLLVPYLLALLIGSAIYGLAWTSHWYLYVFLTNFLMAFKFPHPSAFEPLWSLAVEEQFYIVWPLAVYFLSERWLARICVLLLVAAPVLRGTIHFPTHWPIYALTPFRMDLLAAGALLTIIWRRRGDLVRRWGTVYGYAVGALGGLGVILLAKNHITTFTNTSMSNVVLYESTLLIGVGVILIALAGRGVGILKSKVMAYIGQISYSMYLIHMTILGWPLLQQHLHGAALIIVAFMLTVAYSALSWTLIESRLLGRKRPRPQAPMEPVSTGS